MKNFRPWRILVFDEIGSQEPNGERIHVDYCDVLVLIALALQARGMTDQLLNYVVGVTFCCLSEREWGFFPLFFFSCFRTYRPSAVQYRVVFFVGPGGSNFYAAQGVLH